MSTSAQNDVPDNEAGLRSNLHQVQVEARWVSVGQKTTAAIKAGDWIVTGTTRKNLDWGLVYLGDDGRLWCAWYASIAMTPIGDVGMQIGDGSNTEVYIDRDSAMDRFEKRFAALPPMAR